MTTRGLTDGERTLAASVFGDAIDYDAVRIHARKYFPLQPKKTAMAPNGAIWLHPKSTLWTENFAKEKLGRRGLFIHEMTHIWQHQMGIFLPLKRHPFCRYSYSIKPGWKLDRYGLEQQAEIVRHVFLLREGGKVPGAPARGQLESILPFKAITPPSSPPPPAKAAAAAP